MQYKKWQEGYYGRMEDMSIAELNTYKDAIEERIKSGSADDLEVDILTFKKEAVIKIIEIRTKYQEGTL